MELAGRRILVAGANGVLGHAIAAGLAERGALVIGTARSEESAAGLPTWLHERLLLDLEDATSITRLAEYLLATGVDGVVNAAGRVGFGAPQDTPAVDAERLMRVNHQGPARLVTAVLPALRASGGAGHAPVVAAITGVVAERAFPGMSAYVASKAAHSAWLQALRLDLRRDGIRVLEARPGHTETGLAGRAVFGTTPRFPQGMTPAHVAGRIVEAIAGDATELASTAFSA